MIYPMMPFAPDLNLGRAYNEVMAFLPDGSWAVLLDHDMMFTTRSWYAQFEEAIACQPDAGVFCVVTNRIDAIWQRAQESDRENHDIGYHSRIGAERLKVRTLLDVSETRGFGGVVMCLSKQAWQDCGGFADGLLCVDHSIHFRLQAIGRKAWLHEGLYVYHRRRAFVGELPRDTPRANNCPCRGREPMPTLRVTIEPAAVLA
jgi:GT2 family glycosyltransferase